MITVAAKKIAARNRLPIVWQDAIGSPVITVQPHLSRNLAKSLLSALSPCHNRHRRFSQPMKNNLNQSRRSRTGFTLIELLVVIAIIAILASLLLPVLASAKRHAQVVKAQLDISQIVTAIEKYQSDYGRYPLSKEAELNASTANNGSFTYGGNFKQPSGGLIVTNPIGVLMDGIYRSNDDVVAILGNYTNYPGNTSMFTANTNYQKNPRQVVYLTGTVTSDPTQPGIGPDLVYRDPWGHPYVITIDVNDDEKAEDAFYKTPAVSGAYPNGLILQPDGFYAFHGNVMVWSAGPDGEIDPASAPNVGANKDNIISWK